ncbi:uncharacterized protein LOC117104172 [Anneissia japonica]|uniref:uncharacterized protein LOC117104172 n=1 Tax=Anneissia japonica TaxID=1529436 RepID=UPI001425A085|nr:uncharacterized protein LOC117104172 [Anneissia japonica]
MSVIFGLSSLVSFLVIITLVLSICVCLLRRKNTKLNLKIKETDRSCKNSVSPPAPAVEVKSTVRLLSHASKVICIDESTIKKPDNIIIQENNTELYLGLATNSSNDLEPKEYMERDQAVHSCVLADIHCSRVPGENVMIDIDNESTGSVENIIYVSSDNYWAHLEPISSSDYINAGAQNFKPHERVNPKRSNSLPNFQTQNKKNVVYEDFNH